jgi:hypothetical protein
LISAFSLGLHLQAVEWPQVLPILEERCISCHGPEKTKASLRVDSLSFIALGGSSGAVVTPGDPSRSSFYTLCALPDDDPDRMPAKGEALTAAQLQIIHDWIVHLNPQAFARAAAPTVSDATSFADPWLALSEALPPLDASLIEEGRSRGLVISEPLPGFLAIDAGPRGQAWTDEDSLWLAEVAPHVVSLDLYRCELTSLPRLRRLKHLQHLQVRGNHLTRLPAALRSVAVLNVVDNPGLTADSLTPLASWTALRRIHIAGTGIGAEEVLDLPATVEIVR